MRLLGLVIGALIILASAISFAAPDLRLSLERSVITPAGLYAIAALRIAHWAGVRARRASIAGTADAPRARPHRDHRGTDDAVVRRCPRAGGPELVGECRAVVDAP